MEPALTGPSPIPYFASARESDRGLAAPDTDSTWRPFCLSQPPAPCEPSTHTAPTLQGEPAPSTPGGKMAASTPHPRPWDAWADETPNLGTVLLPESSDTSSQPFSFENLSHLPPSTTSPLDRAPPVAFSPSSIPPSQRHKTALDKNLEDVISITNPEGLYLLTPWEPPIMLYQAGAFPRAKMTLHCLFGTARPWGICTPQRPCLPVHLPAS